MTSVGFSLLRSSAREDEPSVEDRGTSLAAATRSDPNDGGRPLHHVPQPDFLLEDEFGETHPVRLAYGAPGAALGLVSFHFLISRSVCGFCVSCCHPPLIRRQGLVCCRGVQQRRHNAGAGAGPGPDHSELQGGRQCIGQSRPQQRYGAGHKRNGEASSTERYQCPCRVEAGDPVTRGAQPAPAEGQGQIGPAKRPTLLVTGRHGNDPWMAGDDGTADRALVSRSRNDEYTPRQGVVQSLFQHSLALARRGDQRDAQVQHARPRRDAFENGGGEFFGSCAYHLPHIWWSSAEDWAHQQGTIRTDGRSRGLLSPTQNAGHEGPVSAGHAVCLKTRTG